MFLTERQLTALQTEELRSRRPSFDGGPRECLSVPQVKNDCGAHQ
jgi:hypothetical protein